jgi:hypothetical protein
MGLDDYILSPSFIKKEEIIIHKTISRPFAMLTQYAKALRESGQKTYIYKDKGDLRDKYIKTGDLVHPLHPC